MIAPDTSVFVAGLATWHGSAAYRPRVPLNRGVTGGATYDALVGSTAKTAAANY
jgi:hypothetical protein